MRTLIASISCAVALWLAAPASALAPPAAGGCLGAPGCSSLAPSFKYTTNSYLMGLYSAELAVAPDGRHAYYVESGYANKVKGRRQRNSTLVAIAYDAASGRLSRVPGRAGCANAAGRGGCARVRGMDMARDVVVAPDGRFVYVASDNSMGVAIFKRDPASGTIRQLAGRDGCLRGRPVRQRSRENCRFLSRALRPVDTVNVTPDGRFLYVSGVPFHRSVTTGLLTPVSPSLLTAEGFRFDPHQQNHHGDYSFTADSRFAYFLDDAGTLAGARVDPATGRFTNVSCNLLGTVRDRCEAYQDAVAIGRDGRHVYFVDGEALRTATLAPDGAMTARPETVSVCSRGCGARYAMAAAPTAVYVARERAVLEHPLDPASGLPVAGAGVPFAKEVREVELDAAAATLFARVRGAVYAMRTGRQTP